MIMAIMAEHVKTQSLETRNKHSMWSNNDITEGTYKGVRVKYTGG